MAIGREVIGADGVYELREGDVFYSPNFAGENSGLRPENSYFWNLSIKILTTLLGPNPQALCRPEHTARTDVPSVRCSAAAPLGN
jgi:hypothetical protein